MKRFFACWQCKPQLHVHFVRCGNETNPLAEQAVKGLKKAVASLSRTVDLVEHLQVEVAPLREELQRMPQLNGAGCAS